MGADLYQGLNDVGFPPAPNAVTYGVGEATHGTGHQDLDGIPDAVAATTGTPAANAAHPARWSKAAGCPPG